MDKYTRDVKSPIAHIVTLPKVSRAVLTTAAPSVTDELFATALPPPRNRPKSLDWMIYLAGAPTEIVAYLGQ